MEGLFTSKDILDYIATEKSKGISFTRELSLYFKATQKDLDESLDNLKLWINYTDLLSVDCDPMEIRGIFKILKLRYWKFLEYWKALINFEIKRRSPSEFEEKVVSSSMCFVRTKEFAGKEAVIEYLEKFSARNLARDKPGRCSLDGGRTEAGAEEGGMAAKVQDETQIKVPLSSKPGDTDFDITGQISRMRRGGGGEKEELQRMESEKDQAKAHRKGIHAPKKTLPEQSLAYPTPSDSNASNVSNGALPKRQVGLEFVNIKLETMEVPFLVFKGQDLHLIKELGKGGSSKVYQVLYNDQIFALKRVTLREEQRESFIDEIRVLSKLKGQKGIIELVDYDLKGNKLDLLLECGDTDLGSVIRSSSMTLSFIRDIWEQVLQIVSLVHRQRIIHKDLKPANFLFVKGRLKLIDFGISKEMKSDTTKVFNETQIGTVNYMSPESLDRDIKLGRSTDVWSLGCILYEMVYGHTPLNKYSNVVQKIKRLQDEKTPIEYPATPFWEMVPVIKRCLVRDRSKRATIEELQDDKGVFRVHASDLEALVRRATGGTKSAKTVVDEFLRGLGMQER